MTTSNTGQSNAAVSIASTLTSLTLAGQCDDLPVGGVLRQHALHLTGGKLSILLATRSSIVVHVIVDWIQPWINAWKLGVVASIQHCLIILVLPAHFNARIFLRGGRVRGRIGDAVVQQVGVDGKGVVAGCDVLGCGRVGAAVGCVSR
jgi:hypothetical protein